MITELPIIYLRQSRRVRLPRRAVALPVVVVCMRQNCANIIMKMGAAKKAAAAKKVAAEAPYDPEDAWLTIPKFKLSVNDEYWGHEV